MLYNYLQNTLFWGILVRSLTVKTLLFLEADAVSALMCAK